MNAPPASTDVRAYADRIAADGYAIEPGVISPGHVADLRAAIAALPDSDAVRRKQGVYGVRNLLEISDATRALAVSPEIRRCVTPILGEGCFAVRATFFDKVADANWKLRWHQDSVIALKERLEVDGFHAWAVKSGVLQARPPVGVLANMLAIRVHLDDSTRENGPLRVLPGSHRRRWERDDLDEAKDLFSEVVCEASEGGVLAMRPLLLHASAASESAKPRRVIHLEYAVDDLPDGLEWRWRIA